MKILIHNLRNNIQATGRCIPVKKNTKPHANYQNITEYIQFLIEPKSKQFAIRACKEDAPNAVRFSKPEGEQKAQIKISNATVVDMVRKLMDWNAEDNWNVPGIYFAEEQGIMYALESAYAPRAKGGWAARREREAAAALAESSIDNEEVNN